MNRLRLLICLFLGAGLFSLGYWTGQRSQAAPLKTARAQDKPGLDQGGKGTHPVSLAPNSSGSLGNSNGTPPANASPEMKEFLQNRATLAGNMAKLRGPGPETATSPSGATALDTQNIARQFREQNKELLDRQAELSRTLAQQSSRNPMTLPPPLRMPPNATPEMQAYLTARDKIMRSQMEVMNNNRTADPQVRAVAMRQWQKENEAQIQQLQELRQQQAQALSKNNPSPKENQ